MQSVFAKRRPPSEIAEASEISSKDCQALGEIIRDLLPGSENPIYAVANFHFESTGKVLRGRTSLAVGTAIGLKRETALRWAAAVELMHNASLIHDDICDRDHRRRNQSSVQAAFGVPLALCFGDWLVARSFELGVSAAESSGGLGAAAVNSLAMGMRRLCEGQAREFSGKPVLIWEDYFRVVEEKTVPLVLAAIEGPLLLGGLGQYLPVVRKAVHPLGLAYQMANDMLDILGDDGGTEALSDLRKGSPNVVLVSFRNKLNSGNQSEFDLWMESPGSENFENIAEEILTGPCLNHCCKRLEQCLEEFQSHCSILPNNLQYAMEPLIAYLQYITKSVSQLAKETSS